MLIDKKIYLIFLLILLVSFSGCLDFITTREKQACLALTHYSSTSIDDCSSQKRCFTEIEELSISKNNNLPLSLSKEIDAYKNYLASSHYYYTLTKKELDVLHQGCENENIKTILDNYNSTMDLFSKTFSYVDNATKKSMFIVIDYALFLKSQDVDLIAEEDLFQDYVVLNENINYMKKQEENNSYLSTVNREVKKLHDYSRDLGFKETYLAKENLSDLTLYYLEVYGQEINSQEINMPEIMRINSYVYKKLSNIEDLRNINYSLNKLDGYNFYILINNLVGKEKSLVTEFKELNNRVSKNLTTIYDKIDDYQQTIEENKEFLSDEKYQVFLKEKNDFYNKTSTFGKHLSFLKQTNLEILQNQKDYQEEKLEDEELFGCDVFIEGLEDYSNIHVSGLISDYKKSNNLVEKKELCNKIKNTLEIEECQEKVHKFIESGLQEAKDYELFVYTTQEECIEHINNINYKLNSNLEILIVKNKIQEIDKKIQEIYIENQNQENYTKLSLFKNEINLLKGKNNIDLILEINQVHERLNEIEKELNNIIKKIIQEDRNHKIIVVDEKYYLEITNNFSEKYLNIEINNRYQAMKSKDTQINIAPNKITVYGVYPGKNYYLVELENQTTVEFEIVYLSLTESIIKIIIKNDVEGIYNKIDFIEGFQSKTPTAKIEGKEIKYITEKENIIYVFGSLFEVNSSKGVEEITADKFITTTHYTVKNKWQENINRKVILKSDEKTQINSFYKNDKEINLFSENNNLYFIMEIKKNETLEYTLKTLQEKEEVYSQVREIILEGEKLKNSRYKDVSKSTVKNLKHILDEKYSSEYTLEQIKQIFSEYDALQELLLWSGKLVLLEESYLNTLNEILKKELITQETKTLERIERDKYNDMRLAESEISNLFEKIKLREDEKNKEITENNITEFRELKEVVFLNDLKNIDLELLSQDKNIFQLKEIINQKLKEKAEKVYYSINPVTNNLDYGKINELITRVLVLYENYSLTDLYSVGYFAGVTENDAKRLEKNHVFLEGVLFNKELSNFEEKFDAGDYQGALKSISLETINRVEKIKSDYDNLSKGIDQIKEDAKKEIIEYQKSEYLEESLNLAKNNYQEEKYLDVIYLLKQNKEYTKKPKFLQYAITVVIIILFLVVYLYLRLGGKKKEKTLNEKKKKILRN